MARFARRRWTPTIDPTSLPRSARRSCDYAAYIPDRLTGRSFTLDATVSADISDAERALVHLNETVTSLANTEALARLLLRAESVASSHIEGLEIGPRRLLRADLDRDIGARHADGTADEVLGNIDAMTRAIDGTDVHGTITLETLLDVHRQLLAPTRNARYGGQVRHEQNWIGGSSYNPCAADFVPPPPENVPELLGDLVAFSNSDDLSPVAQAAIAHAQFETVHPFVDGNGRVGRALIHMILRRRGLTTRVFAPISLILATHATDYVNGLTAMRYGGKPTSPEVVAGLNLWVGFFASACTRAARDAEAFEKRIDDIVRTWRARLGTVRSHSAVHALIQRLPGVPIVTARSVAEIIGRSDQAANEAIARLAQANILKERTARARNRVYEAVDIIDAFAAFERVLASPKGNTKIAKPTRRTPYRNKRV